MIRDLRRVCARWLLVSLAVVASVTSAATLGCASGPPARYVIERDLGPFAYRRYQKTIDVEITVEGNPAVGHTATYLRRGAAQGEDSDPAHPGIGVTTAFVTVYQHAKSLAAEVRQKLKSLSLYNFSVLEEDGDYVWLLEGGVHERWALWISDNRLVKIGAPGGEDFPPEVIDAYLELYPSDLDEHGVADKDAKSAGAAKPEGSEDANHPLDVPASLRDNAPR